MYMFSQPITNAYKLGEYATLDSPATKQKDQLPPATSPKVSLSGGSSSDPLYRATHCRSQSLTSGSKVAGHEALLPSPRLLFCRGVRVVGESDRGRGRRRPRQRQPLIGPGAAVRVHGVRADGIDLEGRDGLGDRRDAAGLGRHGRPDRRPGAVGRDDGRRPRLLRARQPRHLQRPRALHGARAVLGERHIRRRRRAPRLVLQLRRGHGHGAPHGLRAAALHRRAVARHRRLALPPLRRRRQLRRQAGRQGPQGQGRRRSVTSLCTRRCICIA